jgi:hypothetical protein
MVVECEIITRCIFYCPNDFHISDFFKDFRHRSVCYLDSKLFHHLAEFPQEYPVVIPDSLLKFPLVKPLSRLVALLLMQHHKNLK